MNNSSENSSPPATPDDTFAPLVEPPVEFALQTTEEVPVSNEATQQINKITEDNKANLTPENSMKRDAIQTGENGPRRSEPISENGNKKGDRAGSFVIVLTGKMDRASSMSTPDVDREVYAINSSASPPSHTANGRIVPASQYRPRPSSQGELSIRSGNEDYARGDVIRRSDSETRSQAKRTRRRKPMKLGRMRVFRTFTILLSFFAVVSKCLKNELAIH